MTPWRIRTTRRFIDPTVLYVYVLGSVLALAGLRVDRHYARAEDQPAGPDRRALVMAVFSA